MYGSIVCRMCKWYSNGFLIPCFANLIAFFVPSTDLWYAFLSESDLWVKMYSK